MLEGSPEPSLPSPPRFRSKGKFLTWTFPRRFEASQVGQEAVDVLETAKEYFGTPLKASEFLRGGTFKFVSKLSASHLCEPH